MSVPAGKTLASAALAASVLLAPWPAGSVGPVACHLLAFLAALAGLGLSLSDPGPLPKPASPFLAGLLVWSAWVFVQLIPLPASFLALASPRAYQLHAQVMAKDLPPRRSLPLSLTPALTQEELVKLIAFTLAFAATARLGREAPRRALLSGVLFAAAVAVAGFGLLLRAGGLGFAWLPDYHHVGPAIGPFANHNHFADFIAAPALLGPGLMQNRSRVFRLLIVSALLILGSGLLASGSRAGLLATGAEIAFYLLTGKSQARLAGAGFILLALTALAIRLPLLPAGLDRAREDFFSVRWPIWNSALLLCADFPWTGAGAGSFAAVEPAYSLLQLPAAAVHAHCDYLEWLAESGGPMGLFALFTFGWGLVRLAREFRAWDRLTRGALAGVGVLLGHAGVDFSFHVPAVALAAAVLLGLAASYPALENPRPEEAPASC